MIFLFVYFNCPANPQFCCLLEIYLPDVIILSNDPCTPSRVCACCGYYVFKLQRRNDAKRFVRLCASSGMCIKQLVRNKSLNFGSTISDQGCSKNRQKLLIFFPTSYIAPAVARTQKNDSPQNLTAGREKCCGRFLSHKSRRWIIHRVQNKTCSHNYNLFSKKRRDINFEYRRFFSFLSLFFSYTASIYRLCLCASERASTIFEKCSMQKNYAPTTTTHPYGPCDGSAYNSACLVIHYLFAWRLVIYWWATTIYPDLRQHCTYLPAYFWLILRY